jgi:hypothetical protein
MAVTGAMQLMQQKPKLYKRTLKSLYPTGVPETHRIIPTFGSPIRMRTSVVFKTRSHRHSLTDV